MQIDRILAPVTTLGPGRRAVLWTVGCPHGCAGCSNPELWRPDPSHELPTAVAAWQVESLFRACRGLDGITITGGDPLAQPVALLSLLARLRPLTDDILVYTGYTLDAATRDPDRAACLPLIDVLIDGPYVEALNDGKPLKGSSNQTIHFFRNRERYQEALACERAMQPFIGQSGAVMAGIPAKGFRGSFIERLEVCGLRAKLETEPKKSEEGTQYGEQMDP